MTATASIARPPSRSEAWWLIAIVAGALLVSGMAPKDRLTWSMEVVWVIVGLPLVMLAWPRFPLTRLQ